MSEWNLEGGYEKLDQEARARGEKTASWYAEVFDWIMLRVAVAAIAFALVAVILAAWPEVLNALPGIAGGKHD